jgi:hypothetical protein
MVGKQYNCKVQNALIIDSPEKAQISSITGSHMLEKSKNDKIYFYSRSNIIRYFPTGLEKFYNNLNGIYITNGHLKEIHQRDLKFYTKLEFLDLFCNDIEIIEDDLFRFNPNLLAISFHSNPIFHIEPKVFNGLVKLHSLSLGRNRCTDMIAKNNTQEVKDIIENIKSACNNHNYLTIENKVKKLNGNSQNLKSLEVELRNSSLILSSRYVQEKLLMISSIKLSKLLDGMDTTKDQDISLLSINDQINKLKGICFQNFTFEIEANMIYKHNMPLTACIISLIQIITLSCIFMYYFR